MNMKKYFIIAAAALVVLAGCKKGDNAFNDKSSREIHFIADVIDPEVRATLSTNNGFRWDAGSDGTHFGVFSNADNYAASTAMSVGADKRADVTVSVEGTPSLAYLFYGFYYNPTHNANSPDAWFNMSSSQTQTDAGTLDNTTDKIILSSSPVSVSGGETHVQVDFNMLTSFICFNIYASEGSDVTVSSVSFAADAVASSKYLSGKAHVFFPFNASAYIDGVAEGTNTTTVALSNAYSLSSVTDKASASPVFMGVMPCDVTGYTINVNTSEGVYAFHTDGSISFLAGKIKPINLDLKNATTKPGEGPIELTFVYGNPASSVNFGSAGSDQFLNGAIQNLIYGGVYLFNAGARQPAFDAEKIAIVTDASSSSWLHPSFENTSNYQMRIVADSNPTTLARTGYVYLEYNGTRSTNYITVNQDGAAVVVTPTLSKVYLTEISEDGETIAAAATLSLDINGTPSADVLTDMATYSVTLTCGTATATVTNAAGNVQIVFPANATASPKNFTLTATGTTSSSIDFTQAANAGASGCEYTYSFSWTAIDSPYQAFNPNFNEGHWITISSISPAIAAGDVMSKLVPFAFEFSELDASDKAASGLSGTNFASELSVTVMNVTDGGATVQFSIYAGSVSGDAKIVMKNSDGSTYATKYVHIN